MSVTTGKGTAVLGSTAPLLEEGGEAGAVVRDISSAVLVPDMVALAASLRYELFFFLLLLLLLLLLLRLLLPLAIPSAPPLLLVMLPLLSF